MNPGIESSFIIPDKPVPITSKCRATFRGLSIKHNHEKRRGGDWKNGCPKWPPSLLFPVRVCISAHQHLTRTADWELAIMLHLAPCLCITASLLYRPFPPPHPLRLHVFLILPRVPSASLACGGGSLITLQVFFGVPCLLSSATGVSWASNHSCV